LNFEHTFCYSLLGVCLYEKRPSVSGLSTHCTVKICICNIKENSRLSYSKIKIAKNLRTTNRTVRKSMKELYVHWRGVDSEIVPSVIE